MDLPGKVRVHIRLSRPGRGTELKHCCLDRNHLGAVAIDGDKIYDNAYTGRAPVNEH
jgi:hypothetical protein